MDNNIKLLPNIEEYNPLKHAYNNLVLIYIIDGSQVYININTGEWLIWNKDIAIVIRYSNIVNIDIVNGKIGFKAFKIKDLKTNSVKTINIEIKSIKYNEYTKVAYPIYTFTANNVPMFTRWVHPLSGDLYSDVEANKNIGVNTAQEIRDILFLSRLFNINIDDKFSVTSNNLRFNIIVPYNANGVTHYYNLYKHKFNGDARVSRLIDDIIDSLNTKADMTAENLKHSESGEVNRGLKSETRLNDIKVEEKKQSVIKKKDEDLQTKALEYTKKLRAKKQEHPEVSTDTDQLKLKQINEVRKENTEKEHSNYNCELIAIVKAATTGSTKQTIGYKLRFTGNILVLGSVHLVTGSEFNLSCEYLKNNFEDLKNIFHISNASFVKNGDTVFIRAKNGLSIPVVDYNLPITAV